MQDYAEGRPPQERPPLRYELRITDPDFMTRSYVVWVRRVGEVNVAAAYRRRKELFITNQHRTPGAAVGEVVRRIIEGGKPAGKE